MRGAQAAFAVVGQGHGETNSMPVVRDAVFLKPPLAPLLGRLAPRDTIGVHRVVGNNLAHLIHEIFRTRPVGTDGRIREVRRRVCNIAEAEARHARGIGVHPAQRNAHDAVDGHIRHGSIRRLHRTHLERETIGIEPLATSQLLAEKTARG